MTAQHLSDGSRIFSEKGTANSQSGWANLLLCKLFTENYVKMKEFGPRGSGASLAPLIGFANTSDACFLDVYHTTHTSALLHDTFICISTCAEPTIPTS